MSAPELSAVLLGPSVCESAAAAGDPAAQARAIGATRVHGLADAVSPRGEVVAEGLVLWWPAWAQARAPLITALRSWIADHGADAAGRRRRPPSAALVEPVLVAGGARVPLPAAVVLSTPGAVRLRRGAPEVIASAARTRLPGSLELGAPATLSEHLRALNAHSSEVARLRHAWGEHAGAREVVAMPAFAAAALLRAQGARREALPRIVLEAYGRALVAVKLWELETRLEVGA